MPLLHLEKDYANNSAVGKCSDHAQCLVLRSFSGAGRAPPFGCILLQQCMGKMLRFPWKVVAVPVRERGKADICFNFLDHVMLLRGGGLEVVQGGLPSHVFHFGHRGSFRGEGVGLASIARRGRRSNIHRWEWRI